jgi:hypothetical protein
MTAPIPARGPKLRLHHAIDVDRHAHRELCTRGSAARCTNWDNEYTFWDTLAYDVRVESIKRCGRSKLNNLGVGLTLGYQVNDNLGLTFGYRSTVNDNAPTDLRMNGFMLSLVYGWHPLIEGARRLKSTE